MCQYLFLHLCLLVSSLSSGGEARSHGKLPESLQDCASAELHLNDDATTQPALASGMYLYEAIKATGTNPNWGNPAQRGATLLHFAAQFNNSCAVTALLQAGADKDRQDYDGWTPLHYASSYGSIDVVNQLIDDSAKVDIPSKVGITALHKAAYTNHPAIVSILLDAGADMDRQDDNGATPLSLASWNGNLEVVNIFIEHGVDVNIPLNDGPTPMALASFQGHLHVVEALVEAKANDKKVAALDEFINKWHTHFKAVTLKEEQKKMSAALAVEEFIKKFIEEKKHINMSTNIFRQ